MTTTTTMLEEITLLMAGRLVNIKQSGIHDLGEHCERRYAAECILYGHTGIYICIFMYVYVKRSLNGFVSWNSWLMKVVNPSIG